MLDGLNETGMEITYQRIQATVDKFTAVLNENPIALHFSGHGIRNKK